MDRGQLVAVEGKIYEYDRYDKYLDVHFATEIEIDDEGRLTHTHIPCCFSNEKFTFSDDGTDYFTKQQWYGIVEHFIRQDYDDLSSEEITDATEDIVGRCFAYDIPKIHELADYIADYMDR